MIVVRTTFTVSTAQFIARDTCLTSSGCDEIRPVQGFFLVLDETKGYMVHMTLAQ